MTVDEFRKYLAELNHRVTHFYEYEKRAKDQRKEASRNRTYSTQRAGKKITPFKYAKNSEVKFWESKYDKT
tara:strand:- start:1 stop:213 length:213 start_codon:yes stop_codon:yes gene_type:complete